MNVSLTPHLESFVKEKVGSGRYLSASEVVREALRLLEEKDKEQENKLEALRQDIQQGIDSLQEGKGKPLDIEAIKNRGRGLLNQPERR